MRSFHTHRIVFALIFGTCLLLFSTAIVRACNPALLTVCQAYTRAESVFIGKLTKVEELPGNGARVIEARFEVSKVFKGQPNKIEVIRFDGGDCGPQVKQVGIDYFVYKDPPTRVLYAIANYTAPVAASKDDIKYAESLSISKPIFKIYGQIQTVEEEDLKAVVMTISRGKTETTLSLDKNGYFEFSTFEDAEYEIKVSVPFPSVFRTESMGWGNESTGKDHKYPLKFKPNECDYRTIQIIRDK